MTKTIEALKAMANENRLQILDLLKAPVGHFPPMTGVDLERDGVSGRALAEKLGISQPTASEHLRILVQAGLVKSKRVRQWTLFRRSESGIKAAKKAIKTDV